MLRSGVLYAVDCGRREGVVLDMWVRTVGENSNLKLHVESRVAVHVAKPTSEIPGKTMTYTPAMTSLFCPGNLRLFTNKLRFMASEEYLRLSLQIMKAGSI